MTKKVVSERAVVARIRRAAAKEECKFITISKRYGGGYGEVSLHTNALNTLGDDLVHIAKEYGCLKDYEAIENH